MEIISTNIAQPQTFQWHGKEVTTGIYKKPIDVPIHLEKDRVRSDEVSDRKVHGGEFKACYLFSANQYPYWQNLYPNLDWTYGMLGENLTVKNLDEKQLYIGDKYKVGNALIQITQPREPCFKFAHKFGSEAVLQQFIDHGYSGTYVRVLEVGTVKNGDLFQLVERSNNSLSIFHLFKLLYAEHKNKKHISVLLTNEALPPSIKKRLMPFLR
ncbi:MOSC domain-containing protein [Winogradskyella bathintestinalis]|uniref:MOSC domain-containing protein n=1 Tax=Winogradskyella bathintestinalis TaxID=3035208 RepID=A0ABT7ZU88_9FLAO|nr:MOSC domain-containing protein [Winogradskyella bathintestinalis]MDN3492523.1 MOSC domain-containing protein [Winogradskyella bathintestinalis]